jgi:hypothetical protein
MKGRKLTNCNCYDAETVKINITDTGSIPKNSFETILNQVLPQKKGLGTRTR